MSGLSAPPPSGAAFAIWSGPGACRSGVLWAAPFAFGRGWLDQVDELRGRNGSLLAEAVAAHKRRGGDLVLHARGRTTLGVRVGVGLGVFGRDRRPSEHAVLVLVVGAVGDFEVAEGDGFAEVGVEDAVRMRPDCLR